MHVPELSPILEKVRPLRAIASASDIAEDIERMVSRANTPSMGQSVCDEIIIMCNPKAWGDRSVEELGAHAVGWNRYLDELSQLAELCGQAIYDNNKKP